MKKLPETTIATALLFICATCGAGETSDGGNYGCEPDWEIIQKSVERSDLVDYQKLLKQWEGLFEKCQKFEMYKVRLAGLQLKVGNPAAAKETLLSIGDHSVLNSALAQAALLQAEATELVNRSDFRAAHLEDMGPAFQVLAQKYPDEHFVYEMVGNFKLYTGMYADAVLYAERAIQLSPNSWVGYRTLSIALSKSGRYEQAIEAAQRAYEMKKETTFSDPDFMYALSRAYASTGDTEAAKATLVQLLNRKPEVRGSDGYNSAIVFLREKIMLPRTLPDQNSATDR